MASEVMKGARANPFYLLSAACMLLGCYLWSGADSEAPREVIRILPILGWLNLYELLLIGVAVFLYRRGLARDGRCLLFLEAVFMVDLTDLSAETISWSRSAWPLAVAVFVTLAVGKVALVARGLGIDWRALRLPRLALPVALVFALPGLFAAIARTGASLDLALYGAWWTLGLVYALAILWSDEDPWERVRPEVRIAGPQFFRRMLRNAAFVSVAAHVLALHWMYDVTIRACELSPLFLVAALLVIRARDAYDCARLRFALPALAVIFSMPWPHSFALGTTVVFSPFRAALVMAALTYVYDYAIHRQIFFVLSAAGFTLTALAGPTLYLAIERVGDLLDASRARACQLAPSTRAQWGRLAVFAAYALLSVGTWWSARRARSERLGTKP